MEIRGLTLWLVGANIIYVLGKPNAYNFVVGLVETNWRRVDEDIKGCKNWRNSSDC